MTTVRGWSRLPPLLRRLLSAASAAACLLAMPGHALSASSWGDVVKIAQGIALPRPSVDPAGPEATPPSIDGESNKGLNPDRKLSYTCPSAGPGILSAGISNMFDDFQFAAGTCQCKVECPTPFGGSVTLPTLGVVMKVWQGSQFLEVVRHRGCSPVAQGWKMPTPGLTKPVLSSGGKGGFYHVHALPNFALAGLGFGFEGLCHIPSVADSTIYLSEIDFTWNPGNYVESIGSPLSWSDLFTPDPDYFVKKLLWAGDQVIAAAKQMTENLLCVAECTVITGGGKPISGRPFSNCSGCNGLVAPYTGKLTGIGGRRGAELLAHRFANLKMNGVGVLGWRSTTGKEQYCNTGFPRRSPNFPKNEFRLQSLYPASETRMRKFGAPFIPVADEAGKQGAFTEQDYVFILWKRRECCVTAKYCPPTPS